MGFFILLVILVIWGGSKLNEEWKWSHGSAAHDVDYNRMMNDELNGVSRNERMRRYNRGYYNKY